MSTKTIATGALLIGALIQAPGATAQERWGFEVRASGALGTQDEAREDVQAGLAFEGTLRYRFMEHLSAYAGWDWVHFTAEEFIAGPDMTLEETGYAFGLRFEHPFSDGSRNAWWVRAGGTYDHLELENEEGEIVADSGHGMGVEVGLGLAVSIGRTWSATPGLRYRSLSRDLDVDAATIPVDLRYVTFEIGFAKHF